MKDDLGQEGVKASWGIHLSRAKLEQLPLIVMGKLQLFSSFSVCPSLTSGFSTHTKIIFLKLAIIVYLLEMFRNVVLKIVNLVAI